MKSAPSASRRRRLCNFLGSSLPRLAIFVLVAATCRTCFTAEIRVARSEHGATIAVDDQPFAEYLTRSGSKPVVWPVLGPGQLAMTRGYPLDTSKSDEAHDHVHQRSLWFAYGEVNGIDFWSEPGSYKDGKLPPGKQLGTIVHRGFQKLESQDDSATIVTTNDWLAPDGRKILEDERRLTFAATQDARTIDFDIVLRATAGPVEFGDTKEGAFGIRVAESLAVDKNKGGEIKNDHGLTDKAAWGKPAAWVDYHGLVDGQPAGIAVLNHPDSFAYPTRWHVRGYGLFAANPFAAKDFGLESKGGLNLPAGDAIKLSYRVLLHRGDERTGGVSAAFDAYAGQKRP
jgi:hypothetical protein